MTLYIHDQHLNQTNELSEILDLFTVNENRDYRYVKDAN